MSARAIRTKPVDARAMRRAIADTMQALAQDIQTSFIATTATWEHQVDFVVLHLGAGRTIIGTTDLIYQFVNDGTKPHVIRPKPGGVLAFGTPYQPKTTPNRIGSTSGGRGNATVFSRGVEHPGTDARAFDAAIAARAQRTVPQTLQAAITAAVRRST